tara:strand:+ start:640 stop:1593 length:954 start_codon:yes stop_codon:yes gene_type:complete
LQVFKNLMTLPLYFDPKKSLNLFGLSEKFNFLLNLYLKDKLPKVLMLSGNKGSGKATLINHLLFHIFDNVNYDKKSYSFIDKSYFYNQYDNNIYSNIIYLSGSEFKNIKIEDIRILKKKLLQSTISKEPRFIIFDDVELFNNNSLNALLKVIEEPNTNNYFILINNKTKPLIETIKSRCLEIKLILSEKKRQFIIGSLIKKFNINPIINIKSSGLTPGHFIKFNYIFHENNISFDDDFLKNLGILLNLFKKNKDILFIDMATFLTNNYLNKLSNKKKFSIEKTIEYKKFVFENINRYFVYNLNHNSLLTNIHNKINE